MYYDYEAAVKEDVKFWIECNINLADFEGREELEEYLNDTLWAEDSITGNGSGSYTFSRIEAMENLTCNLDLLAEAIEEFGGNLDILKDGPEACDVTIRCYLLSSAIAEVLEDISYTEFEAINNKDYTDNKDYTEFWTK